ncbi:hypothetical protein HJD18_12230 [Thermoleophilia bacterium SCSIO 60948]|nr:hypothetical protein HJD18_12230 [Thermoleophilia bacterium SCSIO 60948]
MTKRLLASLAVVAIAAILLVPSAIGATKKKFGTSIDISYSSEAGAFTGKVGSKVLRCERGRKVTVYVKPEGGERFELGSDQTDSKGRYEIMAGPVLPVGKYYAVVDRKATATTVCLRAQTGAIAR